MCPCFTHQTYTVLSKVCPPASSVTSKSDRLCKSPSPVLNLPGWRWGSITQNPLVAVSRPLHSGVCETRQDIGLPVLHSEISDSGLLRTRGDQQDELFCATRKRNVVDLIFRGRFRRPVRFRVRACVVRCLRFRFFWGGGSKEKKELCKERVMFSYRFFAF